MCTTLIICDEAANTSDVENQQRYYTVQGAFTGTQDQTGPPLAHALVAMGMGPCKNTDDESDPEEFYSCSLLPNIKVKFHGYQVTGAAFMLMRMFGTEIWHRLALG